MLGLLSSILAEIMASSWGSRLGLGCIGARREPQARGPVLVQVPASGAPALWIWGVSVSWAGRAGCSVLGASAAALLGNPLQMARVNF